MARAHLYRPLQDGAGNLQRGATVRLLEPNTTTEISEPLYVDDSGAQVYGQPLTCPTGYLSLYLDRRKRVDVAVTPYGGGSETIFPDIDIVGSLVLAADVTLNSLHNLTSTDVQSAIQELADNSAGPGNRQKAVETPFTPAGSIAATNVQAGMEEIATEYIAADTTHAAAADPHPQYETSAEAAAKVTAHAAAADPHPIYLTQTEGDGRYIQTIAEEGTALTQRSTVNFIGRRITAVDDATNSRTNVTVAQPFSLKTANYTLVAATDDVVFFNGATLTATLPAATVASSLGVQFTVKNINATNLTVATVAGLIDGQTTRTLAQYDALTVVSDGTNWGVI